MWARGKHAICALFGSVLGFGASVTLNDISSPSIASAPSPTGVVLGLMFSEAHAGHMLRKRNRKRNAAERLAEELRRRVEAERKLQGTRRANLPAYCAYDSYASASYGTEVYS